MNYKSILLSAAALGIVLVTVFTATTETRENEFYVKARKDKSQKEMAEARGSSEYFHMLRANPATGKIDPQDVAATEAQLIQMRQNSSKTTALNQLEWSEKGPNNIGGRTRAVICDRDDPNKIYMGMTSGGFWTSPDRGNTWNKMKGNDSIMRGSVTCVTQAINGDLYYGTGESFTGGGTLAGSLGFPGNGVYKSSDRGVSVSHLTATSAPYNATNDAWNYVNQIKAHPTDANRVIAATQRGLRQTLDGGTTWSSIGPGQFPFVDLDISASGNVMIASTANLIYLSTDGGATFQSINNNTYNLPGGSGVNRIDVAIAPSDEDVMYIVMSQPGGTRGVYKTIDKGTNWTSLANGGSNAFNPLGDQGFYDIAFGVHPTDPGILFLGGQLELWRYTSQTSTWKPIAYWQGVSGTTRVHADLHGVQFNTLAPDEMYVITDGGFFRTADSRALNPVFIEKNKNYATLQCYGVAANAIGHMIFGAQDNGTSIIDGSITNSPQHARDQMGGDGMRGDASDVDYNFLFGTSQNGNLRRSTDGGSSQASFRSIFDKNIDIDNVGSPDEGGPWVTPIELKENLNGTFTKSVLFMGLNNRVWFTQTAVGTDRVVWFPLYTRTGASFASITLNENGTAAFIGDRSGRITRITGIDLYNTRYKYDDTTDNLLVNGFAMGNSFVADAMPTGGWSGNYIADLECDASGNELLVTIPHYGRALHVFNSLNALSPTPTFSTIQGNLPAMPVYSCAILTGTGNYLVGTEMGVFGTDNGGAEWDEMNNINVGAENTWHPRVAVTEIDVKQVLFTDSGDWYGDIIYTGTYGRGVFQSLNYATLSPPAPVSVNNVTKSNTKLSVYPNPVSDVATLSYDAIKNSLASIQVISLTGRVLRQQQVSLNSGSNKINVSMAGLSKGVYMIHMNSTNGYVTAKVIKR